MVQPHSQTAELTRDSTTREKILAAARTVFLRRGTADARTQEIADEAGVNKALLHYYFGTKEALAREVVAESLLVLFPRLFAILADPDRSVEQKVRDAIEFETGFLLDEPYLPGFVAAEMHTHPERLVALVGDAAPPALDALRRQVAEATAAGTMRAIDANQFIVSLLASIIFPFVMRPVIEKLVLGEGKSFEQFIAERRAILGDFLIGGLRP
ncbi:MAG: TetR/AcrR family transcriptional regulator [Gemmatimonadaceae bacterium]|nr:TetR/AcrR family transcriptional regulator [Gemmatimonadaceae bacterium]